EVLARIRVNSPFPHAPLKIQSAEAAFETVLQNAGATLPRRDAVDQRIIEAVKTGRVTAKPGPDLASDLGKVGYSPQTINELIRLVPLGIITHPSQVGGYPDYRGVPYKDSDSDGLPDEWETRHGLNPADPADAAGDLNHDGYTNIEQFLYEGSVL
ncbi:MAG TPA: thrombospondin type 3 repeat-containing protein, partial [Candidatus Paceibacterota bacterium]|nr:thrombospondin type 3 repeat-containing protein [Candidatus Paceibacterota bacterium]